MILLEGVRAVALPCTAALLLPAAAVALAGRLRPLPLGAYAAAVALGVWATGVGVVPAATGTGQLVAAVVLVLGMIAAWRSDGVAGAVGGAAVGAVSTAWWVPCVGSELGAALTAAPTDPVGQLLPLLLYGLGAMLPVVAVAAVGALRRTTIGPGGIADRIGVGLGGLIAAVLATGLWDDVVGELVRRSTG